MHPTCILNLSAGSGTPIHILQSQYPDALIINCDFEIDRCIDGTICVSPYQLPFASHKFDCIISNCNLHGLDLPAFFSECHRMLRPDGCFLWSTFGPDTLKELNILGCDRTMCVDMHDIGDIALQAKFKDPVLDRQDLTVVYPKVTTLLRDLNDMGEIQGSGGFFTIRSALRQSIGSFSASYEILYGLAFAHPSPTEYSIAPVHYA